MDYLLFIECYVTSAEWNSQRRLFLESCKAFVPHSVADEICKLDHHLTAQCCGNICFFLKLTKVEFERYFSTEYFVPQRFAILYGRWMGISKAQEEALASEDGRKRCFQLLADYLKELVDA